MMNKEINKETRGVYAVWVGNYVYVGSGKLKDRVSGNASKLRRGVHSNKRLQKAYNELGELNIEILSIDDSDIKARESEQFFIDYLHTVDDIIVVNQRNASNGATSRAYNKHTRLNEKLVEEIKWYMINTDYKNSELAEMYDCSANAISKIRCGFRWQYVEPKEPEGVVVNG